MPYAAACENPSLSSGISLGIINFRQTRKVVNNPFIDLNQTPTRIVIIRSSIILYESEVQTSGSSNLFAHSALLSILEISVSIDFESKKIL